MQTSIRKDHPIAVALCAKGFVMPGAFNAATARLIERAGFPAVYISGAGPGGRHGGVPDIGLLTLTEVAQSWRATSRTPCASRRWSIADTGFGGVEKSARAVREFERAGLRACTGRPNVPKRCGHLAARRSSRPKRMVEKIRAAVSARRDADFLIVARTDAARGGGFGFRRHRARSYLKAGADAIFPEALESAREFREFARQVRAPLLANMTEFGRSPLLEREPTGRHGLSAGDFPLTTFRVSMKSAEKCLAELKRRGTQRAWLDRMQTRRGVIRLARLRPGRGNLGALIF